VGGSARMLFRRRPYRARGWTRLYRGADRIAARTSHCARPCIRRPRTAGTTQPTLPSSHETGRGEPGGDGGRAGVHLQHTVKRLKEAA